MSENLKPTLLWISSRSKTQQTFGQKSNLPDGVGTTEADVKPKDGLLLLNPEAPSFTFFCKISITYPGTFNVLKTSHVIGLIMVNPLIC